MAGINSYLPMYHLVREAFIGGVYNETYETLFDGGPKCASESPIGFKLILNLILVSPTLPF